MAPSRIESYEKFWPFYLQQHSKHDTRLWHIVGTGAASVLLVAAVISFSYELFLAAIVVGYGPAWASHVMIEKNQPATFRYPLWSLISDFRMAATWLAGGLDREVKRVQINSIR